MGDIENLQTNNVAEPTMTDTPINPIDQLIRDYTMGQIGPVQQAQQVESASTPTVGKDPREWSGFRETANTINKDMAKNAMIKKEQEQTQKLNTISQGLVDETQKILNDAAKGEMSYDDAIVKLGSLQVKAQSVGLKQISDVIEGVANKGVTKLAQMHEKRYLDMTKDLNNNSTSIKDAENTLGIALKGLKLTKEDLPKLGISIDLNKGSYYYDPKSYGKMVYAGEGDKGKNLYVSNKTVDNYIDAIKAAKIKETNPTLSKEIDAARKEKNDIYTEFENDKRSKVYTSMKPQGKKDAAKRYITRLVENNVEPEKAYAYVVNEIEPGLFDKITTLWKAKPEVEWSLENIMGTSMAALKTAETKWIELNKQYNSELGLGEKKEIKSNVKNSSFKSTKEARAAGFKSGDAVVINGVKGTLK